MPPPPSPYPPRPYSLYHSFLVRAGGLYLGVHMSAICPFERPRRASSFCRYFVARSGYCTTREAAVSFLLHSRPCARFGNAKPALDSAQLCMTGYCLDSSMVDKWKRRGTVDRNRVVGVRVPRRVLRSTTFMINAKVVLYRRNTQYSHTQSWSCECVSIIHAFGNSLYRC